MKTLSKGKWLFLTIASAGFLVGCGEEDYSGELAVQHQKLLPLTCTIVLGGGGNSQTISHTFDTLTPYSVNTSSAWDFIRTTSGPCSFTVYNNTSQGGRNVTLGTDISVRIRAGEDGVRNKDSGNGETWKVRSVKIMPQNDTDCHVNIGASGVRMNYYPGEYEHIPAMDRLTYFVGGNCDGKIWNADYFGNTDQYNRFKAIHTNATTVTEGWSRSVYDPGFLVRSMKINNWENTNCVSTTDINLDFGRCLPGHTLSTSIFTTSETADQDRDGLLDYQEDLLANAFRPVVLNHSTEDATNANVYSDYLGNLVTEPVVTFQVRKVPNYPDLLDVIYMQLWRHDFWNCFSCGGCHGHEGDSQWQRIILRTPSTGSLHGRYWYVYSTDSRNKIFSSSTLNTNTSVQSDYNENILDPSALKVYNDNFNISDLVLKERIKEQERIELDELRSSGEIYNESSDLDNSTDFEYTNMAAIDKDKYIPSDPYTDIIMVNDGQTEYYDEFTWEQGDTFLRAPFFERLSTESTSIARHVVYYYSKGKHHTYQDGGWSGQPDKNTDCSLFVTAYTDGRGEQQSTYFGKRAVNLRSPEGKGDRFNFNNAGSRNYHTGFMNDLTNYSFSGKYVWSDTNFYSSEASPVCHAFTCADNYSFNCAFDEN